MSPSVLVDEGITPRLAPALAAELGEGARCSSVQREGWRGLKNSALLAKMVEQGFTILVTADRHVAHQQPVGRLKLAVVVVLRPLTRRSVLARTAAIGQAVRDVQPGGSIEVPAE